MTADTTTETTLEAAYTGPVIKLRMVRADGAAYDVLIRTSTAATIWPPELPGYFAVLENTGANYTIRMGISASSIEIRAYTYTYVNLFGEEGPPAQPAVVETGLSSEVTLQYLAPPDSLGYVPISKVRFYRTAAGATEYLFVAEMQVNPGNPIYVDTIKSSALGETLTTQNYYPPDQALTGLRVMANGILVGFKENEVWFSEPYLPYAFNPEAVKPFQHKIIDACPFEGGVYVLTTAYPYIVSGAAPENMTDVRVPAIQAAVAKGAVCDLGGYIVYASHDGLVVARGLDVSLQQSFQFFTRESWRDQYGDKLDQMRLSAHDGSIVVWFADGTPACLLRFEEEKSSLTRLTEVIYGAFVHPTADALYVSNGNSVTVFRGGDARKSLTWWSKDFITSKPTNFGLLQLVGSGLASVTVYADGAQVLAATVSLDTTGRVVLRLPSGFIARRWSVKFAGQCEIAEAVFANSAAELQGV